MRRLDFRSKKKNRHATSLSLLSTAHPLKRRILRGVYFFPPLMERKKNKTVSIVGTAVQRLLAQFLKVHCVCVCNYLDYSEARPRLKKSLTRLRALHVKVQY